LRGSVGGGREHGRFFLPTPRGEGQHRQEHGGQERQAAAALHHGVSGLGFGSGVERHSVPQSLSQAGRLVNIGGIWFFWRQSAHPGLNPWALEVQAPAFAGEDFWPYARAGGDLLYYRPAVQGGALTHEVY